MPANTLKIDVDLLKANFLEIREHLSRAVKIAAVVKANAYGLGMEGVVPVLVEAGADFIAVARFEEACEIDDFIRTRSGSLRGANLFIMGLCGDNELVEAAERGFILTLDSLRQGEILSRNFHGRKTGPARVHIKLDTGFGRLGIRVKDDPDMTEYKKIAALPGIKIEGTFTHLSLGREEDDHRQMRLFQNAVEKVRNAGIDPGILHGCDSIAAFRFPEYRMGAVRLGAVLYGMRPFRAPSADGLNLRFPAVWTSRITRVSSFTEGDSVSYNKAWTAPPGGAKIATLAAGYADGYPRSLGGKAEVLIRGKRCPVVGIICMDQMMVDVSACPEAVPNDEVILLGADEAGNSIDVLELAEWAGTNRNEIISSLGRRVERLYLSRGRIIARLNYLRTPQFRKEKE